MKDSIIQGFKDSARLKVAFIEKNVGIVISVIEAVTETIRRGNKIILFGNGGSAADAQHIAAEFVNRFIIERPPLPAIALTTDTSIITSIGNDADFSDIFSKQIKALGKRDDLAIGLSTSGDSLNVLKALEVSKEMGICTVGITGRDGGKIAGVADFHLNVDSAITPRIQEVHITIGHMICEMVDLQLFKKK